MVDVRTSDPEAARRLSGRSILAALFWLLSCLAILVGGVTLWAHQTLLTSGGWGSIVAGIASDPEVIDATSERLVERVSEAIGVEDVVARLLPGEGTRLAGAITGALESRVAERVAEAAASEAFQDTFVRVNEAGHEAAMRLIRDPDTEAVTSAQGAISINVFPLIEGVLVGLQDAGIIDASRQIPDLSSYEPDPDRVAALETVLGRDIPDDIGTVTLVESERLGTVQSAVRAFDVITIVLFVIAIACVLLALWLSQRRLRMVVWLAIGAIVALLLGRGLTRLVMEAVTGAVRDGPGGITVRATVDSAVDSLMWFSFLLIVVALVVAGAALLIERRAELSSAAATSLAEAGGWRSWLRARSRAIGYVGMGIVGFVVLWNVGGPDITLLAAALVGLILIAVSVLGGRGPDAADEAAGP
jgi:hypothetical protein